VGPALGRGGSRSAVLRRGGTEPTVTDATWCWAGSRRTCSPASCRWTRPPPTGLRDLGAKLGLDLAATGRRHPRDLGLEPGQRAAPDHRPTRTGRTGLRAHHVRRLGSLLLCRLIDIVGVPVGVVPRDPGNLSAFGLLTVDVQVDHVQTHVRAARRWIVARWPTLGRCSAGRRALDAEGFARRTSGASPVPPICATSARPSRYGSACGTARSTPPRPTPPWPHSTTPTSSSTATASGTGRAAGRSGSTCGSPGSARSGAPSCGRWNPPMWTRRRRAPGPCASTRTRGTNRRRPTGARTCRPVPGRRAGDHRGVRRHGAAAPRFHRAVDHLGNLVVARGTTA
jgi:hypothetical protein